MIKPYHRLYSLTLNDSVMMETGCGESVTVKIKLLPRKKYFFIFCESFDFPKSGVDVCCGRITRRSPTP